ncbi:hypothetical protein QE152_g24270 [Popillia japonica]|uniref:Uncharacterized protein n=1 Tax=Popillia japonica TaxID=7064 RepID=A0AAW1KCE7_POPJA
MLESGLHDCNYKQYIENIRQDYNNCTEQRRLNAKNAYWWNNAIEQKRRECLKDNAIEQKRRECLKARRRRVRAAGSSTHRGTQNTDDDYKTCKRKLGKLIRNTKRKCWKDLCRELRLQDMQKKARQVDKKHEKKMLEGSMPGTRYKHLGRRIQDSHQKVRVLNSI